MSSQRMASVCGKTGEPGGDRTRDNLIKSRVSGVPTDASVYHKWRPARAKRLARAVPIPLYTSLYNIVR